MLLALVIMLPWIAAAFGGWLSYQLLRQNGRILLHLDLLEDRLKQLRAAPQPAPAPAQGEAPQLPPGLPVGSQAPEFDLRDLAGGRRALSHFRGQRVLLIFFNTRCGFCSQIGPDLAALPTDGENGRPIPIVITTGDAAENRPFFQEHGIRCPVLLQEQSDIAAQYQAGGTPMGYLIDGEGKIASEIAAGGPALLALAVPRPDPQPPTSNPQPPTPHKEPKGNRSIEESRIPRQGLAAGTPAPEFTLPQLDGGELSLEEYRGRRVLLVFSDPKCGPCSALTPQLELAYRRSGDVQVVMVSRGDIDENRAKAEEHGVTFPIVLQRQWEISKEYAMFATPVAYWIDEAGNIAADVATGAEAILALLEEANTWPAAPEERRCSCGKRAGECGCGKKNGRAVAGKQGRR